MKKLRGTEAVLKTMDDLNITDDEFRMFAPITVQRLLTKVALLMEGDDFIKTWPSCLFKDAESFLEWIDRNGGNPLANIPDIE